MLPRFGRRLFGSSGSSGACDGADGEGDDEGFETPPMDEFLAENQTAEEL